MQSLPKRKMIINIADVWKNAALKHQAFMQGIFDKYFQDQANQVGPSSPVEKKLELFLKKYEAIIKSTKNIDFTPAIHEFNINFQDADFNEAKDILNFYFNYDAFSEKKKWRERPWSAYKLCKVAKYFYCPYCQISPIDTSVGKKSGDRSYRPQIDHALTKSDFPFLALTLGNLIPSCERCNGSAIKGRINFNIHPHLNPLVDPEAIGFELVLKNKSLNSLAISKNNYKFKIVIDNLHLLAANNSIETFKISSRYKVLLDEAMSLAARARVESAREQMFKEKFPHLEYKVDDCVGFNPLDDSYKNSAGGKMKLDVFRQWRA